MFTKHHWIMVGDITEQAKERIKNAGGIVHTFDTGVLPLYVVGLPCEILPDQQTDVRYHTWTRSQEAVIEVPSVQLKLSWVSGTDVSPLEASASETTLDVWQEEQ
jgi:hypothetical protein